MQLSGKRVVVVGLGKSGVAAAALCSRRGARVVATDNRPASALSADVAGLQAEIVAGSHAGVDFSGADLIVVSPGVPALPELEQAERAGVEVIGELELGFRMLMAPVACVGGTNGKSTTTVLLGEMLKPALRRVFVGGNLGTPLCEVVDQKWDVLVLEVSSFQLERAPSFRPHVSVLLNISEDHLDRYADFAAYAGAKGNAFVQQGPQDFAIIPAGDAACLREAQRGRGRRLSFGDDADYQVEGRSVLERETGKRFSLESSQLHGHHNLLNAAAAIAAARALGIDELNVRRGLGTFVPLPHRMARCGELGGVSFYDDSKATNVGAAVTALAGLSEDRGVLIAGGRDKHGSYAPLLDALLQKGRGLVLIGEAADRIAAELGERFALRRAGSMDEAVAAAFELAEPGDAVLLSPACSSFDMFKSYAERGEAFVRAVRRLQESQRVKA